MTSRSDELIGAVRQVADYCRIPEGLRVDAEYWPDRGVISLIVCGPDFPKDKRYASSRIEFEELLALAGSYDGHAFIDRVRQEVDYLVRRYRGPEVRAFRFQKKNPKHLRKAVTS